MATNQKEVKKTHISTFRLDLRPSADLKTKSPRKAEDEFQPSEILEKKRGAAVEFQDPQPQVVVGVGGTARLHCRFRASGPVASCWIHNSEKVVLEGSRVCLRKSSSGCALILSQVLPEDGGAYSLFVCNRVGTAHRTITLKVIDRPDPPGSCPFVSQLRSSSLVLSWSGPCYDGGSAITGYVVELQRLDTDLGTWTELTSGYQSTSYRVGAGLEPLGQYCFRVRACNAAGTSDPSAVSDSIKMMAGGPEEEDVTSYEDVVIDTKNKVRDHYEVHEKLGVGKFSDVFRITHKRTARVCAGKFYRARVSRDKMAARREIRLMNELHHPKLVQCLAAYDTPREIVMILEYISGGELFERIVDDGFDHTEPNCVKYVRQILEGIQYIHHKSIIHLDLKPENIVCVNATGSLIKIIDFGLACKLEPGKPLKVLHGTPEFVAPEVVNYEAVDQASDMWSIGIICYILLSGESPFQGNTDAETLALVTEAQWEFNPESFDDITDEAKDFISGLLTKDARVRTSCDQALLHPWMVLFDDSRTSKSLNKDKMKRFLARRKWKKTGKALLALKRMARFTKTDGAEIPANPDTGKSVKTFCNASQCESSCDLGREAEQAVAALEKQLCAEPRFHQSLCDVTERGGATVELLCAVHGFPEPEVVWLFEEKPLEHTEHVQLKREPDGLCTLTLVCVHPKDSGIYKCCATNSQGRALCSARLTVQQ